MAEVKSMSLGEGMTVGRQLYYIKNKDKTLGTFSWATPNVVELEGDQGLPQFIASDVNAWVASRTPPKHREYMYKLMELLQLKTTKGIIDYSHGLSLTDTLWITPDESLRWADVNLFENEFDEVIAQTAFDGGMYGMPFSTTSPEFGTDGMLPKCWVREADSTIQLYKGGTGIAYNAGFEPYCEVMASQVLDCLGYRHVRYTLGNFHGRLVSKCPLLTDEWKMLLPIHRYYSFSNFGQLMDLVCRDNLGRSLSEYLIFDYLTANTDRHAGNIGVLLDANNFGLLNLAPIFDNGMSMLSYIPRDKTPEEYAATLTPALYQEFEEGVLYAKKIIGHNHGVEKLINFKFDRTQLGELSPQRIDALEEWLQTRVFSFLNL